MFLAKSRLLRITIALIVSAILMYMMMWTLGQQLPQFPVVSNVKSNSVTFSWYTHQPTAGCIILVNWPELKRGCSPKTTFNHYFTIQSLTPDSRYQVYYQSRLRVVKITSFRTPKTEAALSKAKAIGSGTVMAEGGKPVAGVAIILNYDGKILSGVTDDTGKYQVDLSTLTGDWGIASVNVVVNAYSYSPFTEVLPAGIYSPYPDITLQPR